MSCLAPLMSYRSILVKLLLLTWDASILLLHLLQNLASTRGSATAEEPRDTLSQLKYYGRFLTELLTKSSANPQEPCEHTVS